jgi:hypothetical protein
MVFLHLQCLEKYFLSSCASMKTLATFGYFTENRLRLTEQFTDGGFPFAATSSLKRGLLEGFHH